MSRKNLARGSATRTANMAQRKERILACAVNLIAQRGYDDFTLGQLAKEAKVTVPTIHNLIGRKSQIFALLVEDMVSRTESTLDDIELDDPISTVETFVNNLIELYSSNQDLYRAAFVAGERAKLFEQELPSGIFSKALELAKNVCDKARDEGFLQGQIDGGQLAQQLFAGQRLARHDWMNGYIDLAQYRTQVLSSMYITLAADATPEYRRQLVRAINALN